jgi:hypothetical protein
LWQVNADAWLVWQETRTQLIAGGMGVLGINYAEVRKAFQDLGIERTRALDLKIKALERSMLDNAGSGRNHKGGKKNPQVAGKKPGRS